MNFDQELERRVAETEEVIRKYLPKEEGYQKRVLEAMNYSILAGGKRLRPLLLLECCRMFGGTKKAAEPFMAAIEMIHTYSLVHDDLPAMDNDAYRRGRKTTHIVYGEGMAVLAGDGLLNYAFETALQAFLFTDQTEQVIKALRVFARKAGIYGMIGGQTADIAAEEKQKDVTEDMLLFIHRHKTAALLQSAMMTGALLAGAGQEEVDRLEEAASRIGLAFQIQDDILDVEGREDKLGKPIGSDAKNGKLTYVSLKGLEQAKEDQRRLSEEAIAILASFSQRNEFLEELIQSLITREK